MPPKKLDRPKEDLTGRRFGRLVILGFSHWHLSPKGARTPYWRIRCDCGTERPMNATGIRSGASVSCGCFQREVCGRIAASRAKSTGTAAFNHVFRGYVDRARTKGLAFGLTKDEFRALSQQGCHYCGHPPIHTFKVKGGKQRYNGDYQGNGIDRLDSALGYLPANCVPCCGICNKAKRDLSYDEFTAYLARLVAFRSKHVS